MQKKPFAVIKTGGKQYLVSEGDKIKVEKLARSEGEEFDFNEVLLVAGDSEDDVKIGRPTIKDAKVKAKLLEQGKADKKIVFKYHRKTRYKKKKGHRQPYTKVEILKIAA